jgi:hypothetical protein
MNRMPVTAMSSFREMVERDARAPLTKVVVATRCHATGSTRP